MRLADHPAFARGSQTCWWIHPDHGTAQNSGAIFNKQLNKRFFSHGILASFQQTFKKSPGRGY